MIVNHHGEQVLESDRPRLLEYAEWIYGSGYYKHDWYRKIVLEQKSDPLLAQQESTRMADDISKDRRPTMFDRRCFRRRSA